MSRPKHVPEIAEQFDIIPCLTTKDVPSQFLPGQMQRVFEFHCCGCQTAQPKPKLDTVATCPRCGLSMARGGDLTIWIWREPARVPP